MNSYYLITEKMHSGASAYAYTHIHDSRFSAAFTLICILLIRTFGKKIIIGACVKSTVYSVYS